MSRRLVPSLPSTLRLAVRHVLSDGRLLAAAAVAAVVETGVRVAVGLAVDPVAALLVPPVAAVVALGRRAPAVRAVLADRAAPTAPGVARLVAVAVVGHAAALAAGTATFLVTHTVAAAALYALGVDVPVAATVLAPLVGVAAATLLAWAAVAVAVVGVIDGASTREVIRATAAGVGRGSRDRLALAGGVHLGIAGVLALAGAVGVELAGGPGPALPAVAVAAVVAVLGATFGLALAAAVHLARPPAAGVAPVDPGRAVADPDRPLARVAVACLLVAGLAVGAGAVRATELRPVDVAADPLPADADGAYATARANTYRASHAVRVAVRDTDDGEAFVVDRRIDRADRQYLSTPSGEATGGQVYASTGTGSPPLRGNDVLALGTRTVDGRTVRASPDYLAVADTYDWTGGLTPPPAVDGWRVADRTDGRLVVVLTDPAAVLAATTGVDPGRIRVVDANASRVRAVIDTDRGSIERVETRVDARVRIDGDTSQVAGRTTFEFAVGVDVERPAALGPPSLGERAWRVFAY